MAFNPDALLDFEKRTGVKDSDIDDFLSKVDGIQAQLNGLVDGSIKPEDVKVDGVHTQEELDEINRKKEERRKQLQEEARLRALKKKQEEVRQNPVVVLCILLVFM